MALPKINRETKSAVCLLSFSKRVDRMRRRGEDPRLAVGHIAQHIGLRHEPDEFLAFDYG